MTNSMIDSVMDNAKDLNDQAVQSEGAIVDLRQRFFIEKSPVRGDVVRLQTAYQAVVDRKAYPLAVRCLLGEMLTAASLLIGTLKIEGSLSIQLQSSDESALLNWAMAECNHAGEIRGLADFRADTVDQKQAWQAMTQADEAFAQLGSAGKGVLFINIQPAKGEAYQGIVERVADNLADCLAHYQRQSAQIPTVIKLACDGEQAGGVLLQLLPITEAEKELLDDDLFPRLTMLTNTLKPEELTHLPASEILYRLYNEEEIVVPEAVSLQFACTCSEAKSESAVWQLGEDQALALAAEQGGHLALDCGFCGAVYDFDSAKIKQLFAVG